jgi:hypothetical protein
VKRFTETNKWSDPWFRKLSGQSKLLWDYVCDHCDIIGLIEIDLELVSHDCGMKITDQHLKELASRMQVLGRGKFFLTKFIEFQYGKLSGACKPHQRIIALIETHGITRNGLGYIYPGEGRMPPELVDPEFEIPKIRGFERPALETCKFQGLKTGLPESESEKFFHYYESNGWKVGKNPMRSWQSAMVNWKKNWQERNLYGTGSKTNPRNAGITKQASAQGAEIAAHLARTNQPHYESVPQ